MKTKIKDTLLSNLGLKLLSLVVAAVLWFVVVNVENPETRKNFTVNVTFTNEASLAEQNLYYKVNGTGTVKVTLSGKRSIIEKLSTSDISAVADLSRREEGKVPVDISLNRYSGQVTPSSKQLYIAIEVGDMATNRFNVTGQTTGTPSSGHVLNSVSVSPNVITVEGPGEIVSTIDLVTATCNIDGASDDITEAVVPKFYDENGKQVDTSELTINVTTVEVTADIQVHAAIGEARGILHLASGQKDHTIYGSGNGFAQGLHTVEDSLGGGSGQLHTLRSGGKPITLKVLYGGVNRQGNGSLDGKFARSFHL